MPKKRRRALRKFGANEKAGSSSSYVLDSRGNGSDPYTPEKKSEIGSCVWVVKGCVWSEKATERKVGE